MLSTPRTIALLIILTFYSGSSVSSSAIAQAPSSAPATAVANTDDGDWPMATKDYTNQRFSALDQINMQNVKDLKLAWSFDTGVNRGQEAAPCVVGDTMYVVTPFPNILYAIDLKDQPGKMKWKYEPKPTPASKGVACCDQVNRGCVVENGRVYYNTLDNHTVCVDANTGNEIWKIKLGDINRGESMTMAPLVVKGKVLVGNSGGEYGVRGWLTALDANTGHIAWRAYNTGPDNECLIGDRFKPFYDSDKGKDLGVHSWPPDHWQIGGGTVWGFLSYDPELDLVYYGTANPGCWNPELRPGDNKWSAGIFARDPDDGQAVWYYQWSPHDLFDHDGINENVLLELPVDGPDRPKRNVLIHPDRNGYMYVLDRTTGQVISATPFVRITASKGVDLTSGRLTYAEDKKPEMGKVIRDVQPASPGAKDWQPMSWSPRTNLLYVPHQNLSCDYESVEAGYIAGTPFVGVNEKMYAGPPGDHLGLLTAWDPVKKQAVWQNKEMFPCWSGTVVTAGDVVFYGTMEGWFKAVDARDGKELWKFQTSSGIIGQPVSYRGPDGKQYIAVLSGVGGWAGAIVVGGLDSRDPTAATGFANAMRELPNYTKAGGTLYVFSLP